MDLSEYILEPLRKDGEFTLYRGQHRNPEHARRSSILLMAPMSRHRAPSNLIQVGHERSLSYELDLAWDVRPIGVVQHDKQPVLVLENPAGEPLEALIRQRMETGQFCRIALVKAFEEIKRLNDRLQGENVTLREQVDHASDPALEIKHLRRCINDLAGVLMFPVVWRGREPAEILATFVDSLMAMLKLDFFYARVMLKAGERPLEVLRVGPSYQTSEESGQISELIAEWIKERRGEPPPQARRQIGNREIAFFPMRMGIEGELGLIVAGSQRAEFPKQTESLVLGVAANQLAIRLQQALLLSEQKRAASELDRRVAKRTRQLAEINEELQLQAEMLQHLPVSAWTLKPDGTPDFVNQVWLEFSGQTLDFVRSHPEAWMTAVHPEDRETASRAFRDGVRSGKGFAIETRSLRAKDGTYRWHLQQAVVLRDAEGKVVKFVGTTTDIDDQKRAEEELRTSEGKLRRVIDTIPTLSWCNLPDGPNEFLSKSWHEYTGLSPEEAHGWGWSAAFHPDDLLPFMKRWQELLISGQPGEIEARLRRYDGEYRWFLIRVAPFRDETGAILRWYGTSTDIHDQKLAQNQALRSEAFLAEAQHLARLGSFSWRVSTGDIKWSEQLYRIFEFDPGISVTLDLIGSRIHPEDLPVLDSMIGSAQRAQTDLEYQLRLLMPDGSIKFLHLVAHASPDHEGQLEYVGAVQDVTQRQLAEAALAKARSELAKVTRIMSLGVLTASIAHEVNQPLSGIVTNASTCLRMLDSTPPNLEGARETARRAIRDGNRASDVISRLRALFGKREVTAEPVDLNEAVREVIALSLSDLQRHRVILQLELSERLPLLNGDRIQLQQVVLNLLRNASEAMSGVEDRPRRLLITTEQQGKDIRLTVQDSGVGLAPSDVERLFESFYTTKEDGMGIGLSISRSIIEAHHGRIWVTANAGPGATFAFSIPCEHSS